MTLSFYKYQGTGNDFVMIDNRLGSFDGSNISLIQLICNRRLGIGSDGLILLNTAEGFDFQMVYFNADGSQSMCGNGARCAVAFAHFLGICGDKARFLAPDGAHEAEIAGELIKLSMIAVPFITTVGDDFFVDTGAPHHIRYVDNLHLYPVVKEGSKIRYNKDIYPQGANVNFVSPLSDQAIEVRTYERGVEDETLSCGTGVTACALLFGSQRGSENIDIHTKGGILQVSFASDGKGGFEKIQLIGPAKQVFQGTMEIKEEEMPS